MLWTPPGPCFQSRLTNVAAGTRPASSTGTQITAGASNTKPGSYTEVLGGASVTHDIYAMLVTFSEGNFAADNCEIFCDIGIDPANGGSYTLKIANLMAGHAGGLDSGATGGGVGGIHYYFPLFFPSGTQFGVQAQTNDNTTKTFRITLHLFGKPKYPHMVRAGAGVDTFGANTGTTVGVTITPGTGSEGAWADISGADTTKPYWFWEMGMSTADTTMTNNILYGMDLGVGDGSNKYLVQEDQYWVANASECLNKDGSRIMQGYYDVGAGVRPYVRSQCSGTADANMSACVYAVYG